jgi:tRNA-2-methylthio-N6-dimethylallyladenosine synthase
VRFDNFYSFIYSQRPGTSAAGRPSTLTEAEKLARLTRLQNEARKYSKERHVEEIGKIREILIEGPSKKDASRLTGRTSQNVPAHIDVSSGCQVGDLVQVKVIDATLTHLKVEKLTNQPSLSASSALEML